MADIKDDQQQHQLQHAADPQHQQQEKLEQHEQQQQQQHQPSLSLSLQDRQESLSPEDLQSFFSNIEEPSPHMSSPADEYRPLGSPRYSVWGAGRQSVLWSGVSSQSSVSEEESQTLEEEEGWFNFIRNVFPHFFGGDAIKQRQAKLLLLEALDHFDLINDLFFIIRVSLVLWRRRGFHELPSLRFVLLWLGCLRLFIPLAVFGEIKRSGVECPQALFMFERLTWTFQLLMRAVEDLPQLLMSFIYLINCGKDNYAIAVISYSTIMFIITSIRMGKRYPFKGTLYLLFSSRAPIDDPVAQEAAPTTTEITLFMSFGKPLRHVECCQRDRSTICIADMETL
ncbi:Conserved Plasmodium membrane protein, related [Eimeria maxima]|uniref:Conserved Plasmodium membrane protein, related n=1 Tax=Eimeria maxima TaxID=5804 RepID=U6MEM1_EIMMA|nr:Conserved Plasmodium membrane protein, related [Eimeria maxima]CDJ61508.1 Conserved Plasmodium membrane protein, related [Eimeria maxima]